MNSAILCIGKLKIRIFTTHEVVDNWIYGAVKIT